MLGLRPEMLIQDSPQGCSSDTATLELALQRAGASLTAGIPVETLPACLEKADDFFGPGSASLEGDDRAEGEFRTLYHRGKITDKDIAAAMTRLGFPDSRDLVLPGLTRSTLDYALLTRSDQRTDPALRDWVLSLPWAGFETGPADESWPLGEVCRLNFDPFFTHATRRILLPHCEMFCQKDNEKKSFWDFFLANVSIEGIRTSFGKALEADACRRLANRVGSAETVLELIGLSHTSMRGLENALQKTLQAHPGWSARFRDLARNSSPGEASGSPSALTDFTGAVILVEFHVAADLAARSGNPVGKTPGSAHAIANALLQAAPPGVSALELRREPWDLCLALQHLGYSRKILETLATTESERDLVRAAGSLSLWKRQAIWREALNAMDHSSGASGRSISQSAPNPESFVLKPRTARDVLPVAQGPAKDPQVALRVLLVEDDPLIGKAVSKGLLESGHTCLWVKNGKAGLDEFMTQRHDCVILDLMLPEVAGLDLLRQARAKGVRTPVVILTALGAVEERVAGLRDGADDYLVKPFAFHELLARLEAVRRRASNRPAPALQAGKISLDLTNRRVTCSGNQVDLTPTGFSLLEILMRNAGNIVTRRMLSEHLWEGDCESETNIIEVHVNRLRNKLSRAGAGDVIQTVRGRGYTLKPF